MNDRGSKRAFSVKDGLPYATSYGHESVATWWFDLSKYQIVEREAVESVIGTAITPDQPDREWLADAGFVPFSRTDNLSAMKDYIRSINDREVTKRFSKLEFADLYREFMRSLEVEVWTTKWDEFITDRLKQDIRAWCKANRVRCRD